MISGLVLKYLNGECFVICGCYKYSLLASTKFNLTVPHGPVSLIGDRSLVVMLYNFETSSEEVLLTRELQQKGARVIGLGGPGDIEIGAASEGLTDAIRYLPALQLLGERAAVARAIDTETPRHLTKVVILN